MKADRFVEDHGKSVTKVDYSKSGTDSYGDPVYGTSSTTVQAIYNRERQAAISSDADGVDVIYAADVYLKSTVSVTGADATVPATEFALDGQTWQVTDPDVQPDLIHCHCERVQS